MGDLFRFAAGTALLATVRVAFSLAQFDTLRQGLLRSVDFVAPVPGRTTPGRIVRGIERADHWLPGSRTCLMRSLTAESLLRLYGYEPAHRIGVDTTAGDGFLAHSWIELDGRILIGDLENLSDFEVLPPLDEYDGDIP